LRRPSLSIALKRLRPLGPVFAIVVPLAFLPFSTCLLKIVLGIPCPACGLTRAAIALLRLDFAAATQYQPLALPLSLVAISAPFGAATLEEKTWDRFVQISLGGSAVALFVIWIARFLGFLGGPVP
jgi:hypothetical protein